MPLRMLALVALGQVLGMTLWFSATAAAPRIAQEFSLSPAQSAWLTIAVQGGFVAGTLISATMNLADVFNARRLFAAGCVLGAAANGAIAWAGSAAAVIALRFATGAALACIYPPGMKIAAGWFRERRGTALGIVVGGVGLGSAFPHLLAWTAADVSWRMLMLASSGLALLGGWIVFVAVKDGPYVAPSSPFDPHAVRAVAGARGARLATYGYLGHMWELYAMWAWMPAFASAWLSTTTSGRSQAGSLVAFIAIGSGAVGCVAAGIWADRWGKAKIARAALHASGGCCVAAGVLFGGPPWVLVVLAVVWGFTIVADSAQFSALVSEHSPRTHVGTALTLQTSAGFLLTMISMQLLPIVADGFGWRWAFLVLVPGPVLGAWAMRVLEREDRS